MSLLIPSRWSSKESGATYLIVMFLVVVMGITATAAAKQWKTVMQREREADLLARGVEIQTAIALYSASRQKTSQVATTAGIAAAGWYPLTLEELTKQPKPFLRKVYKDPITGGDWDYIRDPATGRIKGVRTKSKAAPIKQHNFPAVVSHFEGLEHYNEWLFQYPTMGTLQNQLLPGGQSAHGGAHPQQPGMSNPSDIFGNPQAPSPAPQAPSSGAPAPSPATPSIP